MRSAAPSRRSSTRWDVRRAWPTRRGWAAAALAFVLTDLGALGGNNLVVLVASVAWAALLVDGALGWANTRGLSVQRMLPDELFARTGGRGLFVVGRKSRLPAYALQISDGIASAHVSHVDRALPSRQAAWWRMPDRGEVELPVITVRSTFPFGLFDHVVQVDKSVAVLVYPCPGVGVANTFRQTSAEGESSERREGSGDLRDLRPYRAGDRLNAIHWPTSARVGSPMVGIRSAEEDAGALVTLPERPREEAVERATGALLTAWSEGVPVGLAGLEPELAVPRSGVRWRRRLLGRLAVAETVP